MHRGFTCTTEQLVDISEIDSTLAHTATCDLLNLRLKNTVLAKKNKPNKSNIG